MEGEICRISRHRTHQVYACHINWLNDGSKRAVYKQKYNHLKLRGNSFFTS